MSEILRGSDNLPSYAITYANRPKYQQVCVTDRPWDQYSERMGTNFAFLRGNRVLDIGAGKEASFGVAALNKGIDLFSLNPYWARNRDHLKRNGHNVAGLAQALPFRSESFDAVLSMWCVPLWLMNDEKEYTDTFSEVHRVLKPDGIGLFYPVRDEWLASETFHDILQKTLGVENYKFLRKAGDDWTMAYIKTMNPESNLHRIHETAISFIAHQAVDVMKPALIE
jgi:ubiquinone/menaquinone biosynthesis C-methylase UbiE